MAKHREGITSGITSDTTTIENTKKFLESEGVTDYETPTYPDIIDKLTDPVWRPRLEKICAAFENSHHPSYREMVYFLDKQRTNLKTTCEWLSVT